MAKDVKESKKDTPKPKDPEIYTSVPVEKGSILNGVPAVVEES